MSSENDVTENGKASDIKLAAIVVVIALALAGAPLFVYMAITDTNEIGPTTAASNYYRGLITFDEERMYESSIWSLDEMNHQMGSNENIDQEFIQEFRQRLTIVGFEGIEDERISALAIVNIEDHIASISNMFHIEFDDWSMVSVTVHDKKGLELNIDEEWTQYVLVLEVDDKWLVDPLSAVYSLEEYDNQMDWTIGLY